MSPLGVGSQARQRMTMRVAVSRSEHVVSTGGRDAYGSPSVDETLDVQSASMRCYAWAPTDSREVLDADKAATFGAIRLMVPADSDITTDDVLGDVTDRLGRVLFPGPHTVTAVTRRTGHLAVMGRSVQRAS